MTLIREFKWIMKKTGICFAAGLVLAVALLTLAYAIPNDIIKESAERSIAIVKEEYRNDPDREWSGMFGTMGNTVNYGCDRKWMRRAVVDDESLNALEAAMSVNGYTRYWHGYQVIVRPLLAVGSYENMVYLSVLLFTAGMALSFAEIRRRLGLPEAFAFLLSLYCIRIYATAICLNNSGVFIAGMTAILFVTRLTGTEKEKILYPVFMLTGMFANYIDVLTAPLVSLGLPLTVYLAIRIRDRKSTLRQDLLETVAVPAFWGAGYALFWICKWILASLIVGNNAIADAVEQAEFRIAGDATHATTPIGAIRNNVAALWPDDAFTQWLLIALAVLMLLTLLLFAKKFRELARTLPLVCVAASPFLWMCVLSNHSQIHAPFVFRILVVTLFAGLTLFLNMIDINNIRKILRGKEKLGC